MKYYKRKETESDDTIAIYVKKVSRDMYYVYRDARWNTYEPETDKKKDLTEQQLCTYFTEFTYEELVLEMI